MNETTSGARPNASQHDHGSCRFCKGSGKIASKTGKEPLACPKCNGTGTAPKLTTK